WPRKALKEVVTALRHDLAEAAIPYVVDGPEGPLYADLHALRHSYVLLLDQAGVSVKQAMSLARHSDPKLTMARYGRPQLGDLASAVNRLPPLVGQPQEDGSAVLRATGTDPFAAQPLAPGLAPLAPKLAPTVDSKREQLSTIERLAPAGGSVIRPLTGSGLRTNEGESEGPRASDAEEEKRRTPGDRRRASPVGEELVPRLRDGEGPGRGESGARRLRVRGKDEIHNAGAPRTPPGVPGLSPLSGLPSVRRLNAGAGRTCARAPLFSKIFPSRPRGGWTRG